MTYKEISNHLKITIPTLFSIFDRPDLKEEVKDFFRKPKYSEEIINEAKRLKSVGVLSKEIQKILNIPKRTLCRMLKLKIE